MKVLKPDLQITIATLLAAGRSQREISRRVMGIGRETILSYQRRRAPAYTCRELSKQALALMSSRLPQLHCATWQTRAWVSWKQALVLSARDFSGTALAAEIRSPEPEALFQDRQTK